MPGRSHTFTIRKVADALRASHGVMTTTAATLGCARSKLYEFYDKHRAELEPARLEAEGAITDVAESVVARSILQGDVQSARWWLSKRAADRFGDRLDMALGGAQVPAVSITLNFAAPAPAPALAKPSLRLVDGASEVVELKPRDE